ncbi:DUF4214 domain-containing protein [Iamia sp. SCSIO 61187]|uniref:GDSL-type esterase/lipase family protein n=1 Tax=Iamia sp. SCSIO 61187 TaxID=2722752 RepID=UPI001C63A9D2|nr:GDSL-type esterase/lipase family protein [Iamia sp. SCSIO 61187]QYG92376.1 DUF4214 domain-containing protein [Iamia sp. SCSIO 61187]
MVRRVVGAALAAIVACGTVVAGALPAPAAPASPPAVTCPTPLPGPRAVVQLAYVVLLRRCPEPAGAAAWEASLRDGLPAEAFARRITATAEARGVVVDDAYARVLDRPASAIDRAFWAGWLRPEATVARRHDHLLAALAASAEVFATAGGDHGRYVDLLYQRILGRPAEPAGRAHWVARLDGGERRSVVARTLLRLGEPLGVTVDGAWAEVLDAVPPPDQRAADVDRLRADGDRLGLSARLVGSSAFAVRADGRALVRDGRYVALGDSYVVGEGNPPFVVEPDRCGWSAAGYPEVARTSSEHVPGTLDMVACSGATLASLYPSGPQGEAVPGQIDRLAEGDAPALVTLTIGGNDIGFTPILTTCLQVLVGSSQLNGSYSRAGCDAWLDGAVAAIAELRTGQTDGAGGLRSCGGHACTLALAVADVVAAAPGARVVVVGYPPLVHATDAACSGPVRWDDGAPFAEARWLFAGSDVRRGRAVVAALNAALADAAAASGATFVDPATAFAGHAACSADPWVHGLVLSRSGSPASASFHPTRRGGVALAAALTATLEP